MPANQINLLPSEEFEESLVGRILKWSLTSFRVMVIGVELVVISAFLSRFFLDARNTDLNEELKSLQAQILANGDFEKQFRQTQQKLSIYKDLSTQKSTASVLSIISSRLPVDVVLTNISVTEGTLILRGSTTNEASVSQFITNLSSEPTFNKVSLSSVSSGDDILGQFDFTLNLEMGSGKEEG